MEIETTTEHKGVDLLQAISNVLLTRNKIDEDQQKALKQIQTPQHHSRRIAEVLLEYPSLNIELVERASHGDINEARITVRTSTGKTKPFWDFSVHGVAQLVLNEKY